jgi:hypothetical protein
MTTAKAAAPAALAVMAFRDAISVPLPRAGSAPSEAAAERLHLG